MQNARLLLWRKISQHYWVPVMCQSVYFYTLSHVIFMITFNIDDVHLHCMYNETEVWGNLISCLSSHNNGLPNPGYEPHLSESEMNDFPTTTCCLPALRLVA